MSILILLKFIFINSLFNYFKTST